MGAWWVARDGWWAISLGVKNLALLVHYQPYHFVVAFLRGCRILLHSFLFPVLRCCSYYTHPIGPIQCSQKVKVLLARLNLLPLAPPPTPTPQPHTQTLLDGEMVVDEDLLSGNVRRFLIYDLMAVNGHSLVDRQWQERFAVIKDEVGVWG